MRIAWPFGKTRLTAEIFGRYDLPRVFRHVGHHIRNKRKNDRLSVRKLANKLSASPTAIKDWERGFQEPHLHVWPRVIDYLGYDPKPEPESLPELLDALQRRLGFNGKQVAGIVDASVNLFSMWHMENAPFTEMGKAKLEELLRSPVVPKDLRKIARDKKLVGASIEKRRRVTQQPREIPSEAHE